MRDRMFWRIVSVGGVVGLFVIGYGLCRDGRTSLPAASAAYAAEAGPTRPDIAMEILLTNTPSMDLRRAKVPGGWLVFTRWHSADTVVPSYGTTVFYPDPHHEWEKPAAPVGAKP
jgi:hypothetical protein